MIQLEQQVAQYDARRQAQRRPLDFRSGRSLLQGLMQGQNPDPPYIAAARAELKAARRDQQSDARGSGGNAGLTGVDGQLASAIDRVGADAVASGSFRSIVDADRLLRERVADCAVWRSQSGGTLQQSTAALDRQDRSLRQALVGAAGVVAPRAKAEIAAATDTASLDRLAQAYLPTPAAAAAMEDNGVVQAMSMRRATVSANERASNAAAQGRRDAEAAREARMQAAAAARASAAERALVAQQRTAQRSSPAASASPSARGEPTESQMRAALQENAGRVSNRLGMGDWTKISAFEKVGCEKAQGRIGWVCDYIVRMDGNPMSGFMDALAGPGTGMRGSARFVLRSTGWDSFPDEGR